MNPLDSDSDLTPLEWDSSYTKDGLRTVVEEYHGLTGENFWGSLKYFLGRIIPVVAECDMNMTTHGNDLCQGISDLPRIITYGGNLDEFLKLVGDRHNGITLCTDSLGRSVKNDMIRLAGKYAAMRRVHFAHLRNVAVLGSDFEEGTHLPCCGSLDMFGTVKTLVENGFDGYVRPDHGRMTWGETGRAGYGPYDRALDATYLNGLSEAVERVSKQCSDSRSVQRKIRQKT